MLPYAARGTWAVENRMDGPPSTTFGPPYFRLQRPVGSRTALQVRVEPDDEYGPCALGYLALAACSLVSVRDIDRRGRRRSGYADQCERDQGLKAKTSTNRVCFPYLKSRPLPSRA